MEEILIWNNGLFRQPYWYIFLYSKLMVNHPDADETQQGEAGRKEFAYV